MRALVVLAVAFAACAAPPASPPPPEPHPRTDVTARLHELVRTVAETPTAEAVAPLVMTAEARSGRGPVAPLDVSAARDRVHAESALRQIAAMPFADGYTVVEYLVQTESEGTWHAVRVAFVGGAAEDRWFGFLPYGDTYLLGDID